MNIHIITNCSSTRQVAPVAKVEDLPSGLTNAEAIDMWVDILNKNKASTTPREQYRGQGFLTLLKTLTDFQLSSVKIVTGGLGLTGIDDAIVPYDFSGSPKEEHNITQKVTKEPFTLNNWWSMINRKRFNDPTPVKTFIEGMGEGEICVIACTKIFLKYIAQDFLSASDEAKKKCKILLTASSIGSVPMQLRPYIVSFERSSINHIPGNRNDINHRALYHFLKNVPGLEAFQWEAWKLSQTVFGVSEMGETGSVNINEILEERPDLLKLDPESAYKAVYRETGPIGGRQTFKGIFLRAQMEAGLISKPEALEDDDDALGALEGLNLSPAKEVENNQEGIDLLHVFVNAVRKVNPGAEFAAADICAWAEKYCAKKEMKLPDTFSSPIKLVYFLKSYAPIVGIAKTDKNFMLESTQ